MRPFGVSVTANLYFRYMGGVLVAIWIVATVQGLLVYGRIGLSLYVLPTLVALAVGALLARSAVLKRRLHRTSTQFRAIADLAQDIIGPTGFLYVAEETRQIAPVGWQILDRELDDLAQWQSERIAVPLAVNISARQYLEDRSKFHLRQPRQTDAARDLAGHSRPLP